MESSEAIERHRQLDAPITAGRFWPRAKSEIQAVNINVCFRLSRAKYYKWQESVDRVLAAAELAGKINSEQKHLAIITNSAFPGTQVSIRLFSGQTGKRSSFWVRSSGLTNEDYRTLGFIEDTRFKMRAYMVGGQGNLPSQEVVESVFDQMREIFADGNSLVVVRVLFDPPDKKRSRKIGEVKLGLVNINNGIN